MDELRLAFLGRPQVVCGGTLLTGWSLQKSLALLAYLAVTGRPHSREMLAGLQRCLGFPLEPKAR